RNVGLIGGSQGQRIGSYSIGDVYLSYPLVQLLIDASKTTLYSNIISSGSKSFNILNLNSTNTKEVVLEITLNKKEGIPKIKAIMGENVIFDKAISEGETEKVVIPANMLTGNDTINVICSFQGFYFWTTQSCDLSISIYQMKYKQENAIDLRTLVLTRDNLRATILRLNIGEARGDGTAKIDINGKPIYTGKLSSNFTMESGTIALGLVEGANTLSFIAQEGTVYSLSNIKIEFYLPEVSRVERTYSFNVPKDVLESNTTIVKLMVNVKRINVPGMLDFTFMPGHVTYERSVGEGFNHFVINKKDLANLGNTIRISSPNGEFEIGELQIVYE
ncbi:MAG: hypothetical protein QXP04_03960, partial [Candidatus Nanoarchaeia archaeon]|nr:hypothetical protein [Candidatus Jingweiarchaeum tengchongense]